MGQIQVQKVKLIKSEKLEISYKETRDDKSHATIFEERDTKVHPDLTAALGKLSLHLAILADYLTVKNCKTAGALDPFVVTGYSIGGKEDEEGVVITGHKITKSGQAITLNTPFTRFEQDEKSAYYFADAMKDDIDLLEVEVLAYLDGSKKAPEPQLSMFEENKEIFDDQDAVEEEMDAEENTAPKTRKNKKS